MGRGQARPTGRWQAKQFRPDLPTLLGDRALLRLTTDHLSAETTGARAVIESVDRFSADAIPPPFRGADSGFWDSWDHKHDVIRQKVLPWQLRSCGDFFVQNLTLEELLYFDDTAS